MSIYGCTPLGWLPLQPKGTVIGRPWYDIAKNTGRFRKFLVFTMRNGNRILFWKDIWVGTSTLEDPFPDIFRISM